MAARLQEWHSEAGAQLRPLEVAGCHWKMVQAWWNSWATPHGRMMSDDVGWCRMYNCDWGQEKHQMCPPRTFSPWHCTTGVNICEPDGLWWTMMDPKIVVKYSHMPCLLLFSKRPPKPQHSAETVGLQRLLSWSARLFGYCKFRLSVRGTVIWSAGQKYLLYHSALLNKYLEVLTLRRREAYEAVVSAEEMHSSVWSERLATNK